MCSCVSEWASTLGPKEQVWYKSTEQIHDITYTIIHRCLYIFFIVTFCIDIHLLDHFDT